MEFSVKVSKKIFASPESGFGVFKALISGTREYKIIVGNLFNVREGDFLEIEGEEVLHPRFGEQFKVTRFQTVVPQDSEGIVKYLSSGRIKGMGRKTARKIVDQFGALTFAVLENSPEKIMAIPGIRKSVVESIRSTIHETRVIRELTVKLAPFGIGNETIFKIHREFGQESLEIAEHRPYLLIERVRGISFKTADTVARAVGIPENDPARIRAGIIYVIDQVEFQSGDLYLLEEELLERTSRLLDVGGEEVAVELEKLLALQRLYRDEIPEKAIVKPQNFITEKVSAERLFCLSQNGSGETGVAVDFAAVFARLALELTEEQKRAVMAAAQNRMTIITGGPGTGKTTIIRAIIEVFRRANRHVVIAAPTGRAAKRIEESSFYGASTIHRLLKFNPGTGQFVHNRQNPLKADVIIVDEFSMVDSTILYSLLLAIPDDSQLIIIGDKDQLPSVGPGNVMRDMVGSGYFPTIQLHRNFRQTGGSLIVENAHRVNAGEPPLYLPYADDRDFVMIRVGSEAQALEKVVGIVGYYLTEYGFHSPNFQILIPMYRGGSGIDRVNRVIQEKFNPEPFLMRKEKAGYKRLDKVMQMRNNYEKEVFNGDLGYIEGIDAEKNSLLVSFDGRLVEYAADELDELSLAYAVSVHKSQGSEYDVVVLVLLPGHALLLHRELLYTALTRARKRLILLSDESTVERACRNSTPSVRKTLLPLRLKEVFEKK